MERSINYCDTEFTLRYFFDADTSTEGIEVSRTDSGEHIGEIYGETLPDEDADAEEVKLFEHRINVWLDENHC